MQRSAVFATLFSLLAITGCGGGKKTTTVSTPTSITISPSSLSLEQGKFTTLTATVKDQSGNTLTGQTITWSTSNANIADVTTSTGAVCGGKWDSVTAPTLCQIKTPGAADITATSGTLTAKITVTVFVHVARVEVSPMADVCISQAKTLQFTAKAFDAANAAIPATPANFSWTTADATIATIDANGVVTGKRPGTTTVNASLTNAFGIPQAVTTCPPASITLGTQSVTPLETAFTIASGTTKTLAATVTDIKGNPITDIVLTFASMNLGIATASTAGLTSVVTPGAPGTTTVIAGCVPPTCNPGTGQPYYSNPVTVTVSGTTNSKLVVTGTTANGVVVIDGGSAPTAPIAFPTINSKTPQANSLVIAPDGSAAYIGTDIGVLRFDLASNTFLSSFTFGARVLAVSSDGKKVLASDVAGTAFIFDTAANTAQSLSIPGIVAADFASDGSKAYLVGNSTLYTYVLGASAFATSPLASGNADVKFLPQSSVAFATAGSGSDLVASCKNTSIQASGPAGTLLAKSGTSARMWGADASNIYQIDFSGTFAAKSTATVIDCAPDVTFASTPLALGASVTPKQLVSTPNGQKAYLTTNGNLYRATAGGSAVALPLAGTPGTPLSVAVTGDGASAFVGATNQVIHRFDVATDSDVQQISITLKKADGTDAPPDLIAMRLK